MLVVEFVELTLQSTSTGVDIFFSLIRSYFCFLVIAFRPCQGSEPLSNKQTNDIKPESWWMSMLILFQYFSNGSAILAVKLVTLAVDVFFSGTEDRWRPTLRLLIRPQARWSDDLRGVAGNCRGPSEVYHLCPAVDWHTAYLCLLT